MKTAYIAQVFSLARTNSDTVRKGTFCIFITVDVSRWRGPVSPAGNISICVYLGQVDSLGRVTKRYWSLLRLPESDDDTWHATWLDWAMTKSRWLQWPPTDWSMGNEWQWSLHCRQRHLELYEKDELGSGRLRLYKKSPAGQSWKSGLGLIANILASLKGVLARTAETTFP